MKTAVAVLLPLLFFSCSSQNSNYTVETIDGVRYVHNHAPEWNGAPQVALEFVQRIGSLETDDENYQLYNPIDLDVDAGGNIHVLDAGNHRVVVYGPDGTFIRKWGSQGQDPGEFFYPSSIQYVGGTYYVQDLRRLIFLDRNGDETGAISSDEIERYRMKVLPSGNYITTQSTMSLDEEEYLSESIFHIYSSDKEKITGFGVKRNYGDNILTNTGNDVEYTFDRKGSIYAAYTRQNKIEKYAEDGAHLFTVDRVVPYEESEPDPIERTMPGRSSTGSGEVAVFAVRLPEMNRFSRGVQVDAQGRLWVQTVTRQEVQDEENPENEVEEESVLEVLSPEGVLLSRVPIPEGFAVYTYKIYGDSIFFIDRREQMSVFQYRIVG